jgi:hypothetical protein
LDDRLFFRRIPNTIETDVFSRSVATNGVCSMFSINGVDNTEKSDSILANENTMNDLIQRNNIFGFYVRVINKDNQMSIDSELLDFTCVGCMNTISNELSNYYQCSHSDICRNCILQFMDRGFTQCPICRASI